MAGLNFADQQRLNSMRQHAGNLYNSGQIGQALNVVRDMLKIAPKQPQILGMAALMSFEAGEKAQGLKFLKNQRRSIEGGDFPPEAWLGHAATAMEIGEPRRASDALSIAVKTWSEHPAIQLMLAESLKDQGKLEEAYPHAVWATTLDTQNSAAFAVAGVIAQKLEKFDDAVKAYETAINLGHQADDLEHYLGASLLAGGRPDEAIKVCDKWLERDPGHIEALALRGHALQEAGQEDEARKLFDFEFLVKPYEVSGGDEFGDITAFNNALEKHVLNHPSLFTPPESDYKFHHPKLKISDNLLDGEKGPVAALEKEMVRAVDDYLADLKNNAKDHPFAANCPENYKIYAWAAVLDKEGNQNQHVHKDGYLSGCYYVRVPEEVSAEENGQDGDIAGGFEVGRPPDEFGCKSEHMTRQYKPHEGLMLLFPAYFYHKTVPFEGSSKRICIAFDVMPA